MTEVENEFKVGQIPDWGQCATAAWKLVDWINNDNNRIGLLVAVSDKLGLAWDPVTIGTMSSKISGISLIASIAGVINDQMIFIGKYALGDYYGSVVITGSSETGVTSTTTIPSTSIAPTTIATSILTSASPTTFTIPQLIAPNDVITLQTNQNTTFRWSNTGATRYKFEVWNDSTKMNYSFDVNGTSTQFTPGSEGSWRWQVRSYSSNGQAGDAPNTRSFKVMSVPSQPSSGIALYDGPNFTGPFIVLTMGKYSNLADYSWSDRIESIRFLGDYSNNYHVVLSSEKDFTGDPGHYDADASTLGNAQQNHVRSVEIYRKSPGSGIELYDGQNYTGTCVFLPVAYPEAKYADLNSVGFWDRAESIKFVGDCAGGKAHAVLLSEKDFQGDPGHYDQDSPILGNAQRNHVRSVTIYMHQPPGPPTNPNPANGTILTTISSSLDLTFDKNGDQFQIHVWGNNYDQWRNWDSTSGMHIEGLLPGQTYYWQAQAKNNIGVSPLGPQWSFTTAALPTPSAPLTTTTVPPITTPTTLVPGMVQGRVLWNEQPIAGATVYVTELYDFNSTRYGSATTDASGWFVISGIPEGQKYLYVFGNRPEYWVSGVTPFRLEVGKGTVAPDTYLPKGFYPTSPNDGETATDSHPTLRWDSFPDAVGYAVRVIPKGSNSFIFQRGDSGAHITATSVTVDVTLTPGTYYWRVDAFNAQGHIIGASYYPRSFTVAPISPLTTPTNATTQSTLAIGQWTNEDTNTSGITRIIIHYERSSISVQTWGKCHPTDCYWNEYPDVKYAVSDVTKMTMFITWTFNFKISSLKLEVLMDGRLKILVHDHFIDNSGRGDSDFAYYFTKSGE
jgi:hypothetical protein